MLHCEAPPWMFFTNARMITDKSFAEAKLKELNELLAGAEGATEKAYGVVKSKAS
jgi:hypothetical protein